MHFKRPDNPIYSVDQDKLNAAWGRSGRIKQLRKRIARRHREIQDLHKAIHREQHKIWLLLSQWSSYRQVKDMKAKASAAAHKAQMDLKRHNAYLDRIAREKALIEEEYNTQQKRLNKHGNTDTGQKDGGVQSPREDGGGQNQDPHDQGNDQTGSAADS